MDAVLNYLSNKIFIKHIIMYKKNKIKFLTFLVVLLNISCETTELEILTDPNALSPEQSNIDFFLNSIQLDMAYFFEGVSEPGMEVSRIAQMFGPFYDNAYAPSDFNAEWSRVYAGTIADVRTYTPIALERELYTHVAIGQIIESYMIATMVDYFGDIPYTEAFNPAILNPAADSGADIYASLHLLLDDAISNLNKTEAALPANDLYYDGDESKWIKLANTLKLKLYLQSRLVTEAESRTGINAIISGGNYIMDASDDFVFNWSNNAENPDSRHPIFARNFDNGGSITDYMSNHFMNELREGQSVEDPRLRYYIYRQRSTSSESTVEQACFGTLPPTWYGFTIPYCTLDNGYWGRDHGDNGGIPPDTGGRATWGVYPVGGNFDDNSFNSITTRDIGLLGQGISPIMLSSYVQFMLAEANLELGTSGAASTYLESGLTQSITKVVAFGSSIADTDYTPSASDISDYITAVNSSYSSAASNDDKLNIIIKEYFIALYGNGVEAFNSYRRTGKPGALQPLRKEDTNKCLRSFYYPTDYVNLNLNASQKSDVFQKVFWDNNPDTDFIN